MKISKFIICVLFLLFCYSLKAQDNEIKIRANGSILPKEYLYLVGDDMGIEKHGETTRFVLADSSYIDLYYYEQGDSVLLIRSQCAPKCASFVRVYDEHWNELRRIPTPRNMILPEAYVEGGELRWRENFVEDESPK